MDRFRVRRATTRDVEVLVRQRHNMFVEMRHTSPEQSEIGDRNFRRWLRREMKAKRAKF